MGVKGRKIAHHLVECLRVLEGCGVQFNEEERYLLLDPDEDILLSKIDFYNGRIARLEHELAERNAKIAFYEKRLIKAGLKTEGQVEYDHQFEKLLEPVVKSPLEEAAEKVIYKGDAEDYRRRYDSREENADENDDGNEKKSQPVIKNSRQFTESEKRKIRKAYKDSGSVTKTRQMLEMIGLEVSEKTIRRICR